MERIKAGYSEIISKAFSLIPAGIRPMLRPDFLCGTDPVFAGLHNFEEASYGRSYRDTMHVTYDFQQLGPRDHKRTTVVLPDRPKDIWLGALVHEFGHVLHEKLYFDPAPKPITWYAETNHHEAFAEAFAAWVLPLGNGYGAAKDKLYNDDLATVALFEGLANER